MTMKVVVYFVLLAIVKTTFGCGCLQDDTFTDKLCRAVFAGKVTVTGSGTLNNGHYYDIDVSQKDVVKGPRETVRAYRTLQGEFQLSCEGQYLTVGKTYFLTGRAYSEDSKSIQFTTCELAIEYSQFEFDEQYDELRNFAENYNKLHKSVCPTPSA